MAKKTAPKTAAPNVNVAAAADVLDSLAAMLPTNAPTQKGKAPKWEMILTPEAQTSFNRWIEAKTVSEPVETRLKNSKEELNEFCIRDMARRLFETKARPSNPELKTRKKDGSGTVDNQAIFQFTDKFKYRFPAVPEGVSARGHFIQLFVNLGLHEADATRFVDNEIVFTPIMGTRDFNELLQGTFGEGREWIPATAEEQAAGRKLVAFFQATANPGEKVEVEPLTPAEKALCLRRDSGITVKSGFYDRVATYCQSLDQLMAIFTVIQPIAYPNYAKFAMADTPVERNKRLIEAAADILGTTPVKEDK